MKATGIAVFLAICLGGVMLAQGTIDITVETVDVAGNLLDGTLSYRASGGVSGSATGSGTWAIDVDAQVRVEGKWGGLTFSGQDMDTPVDTTVQFDALTGIMSSTPTPGVNRIEIVFEPIEVTGDTIDLTDAHLPGQVWYQVYYPGHKCDAPFIWTMANGGTVKWHGSWGGLTSTTFTGRAYKDTTYTLDALTGECREVSTPGITRCEVAFEPIEVTGVTLRLDGTSLGGKVNRRVYGYGDTTQPSPHVWIMANGGRVSRSGAWGGLSSVGSGYLPVYKDTTYTTDALTGVMTELATAGATQVEFLFEPMEVTGINVDLDGNVLSGRVSHRIYGYANVNGTSPSVWVMANGGRVGRSAMWGGLSSPSVGYVAIHKNTTCVMDAWTGAQTEISTPGENRLEWVYEPIHLTVSNTDSSGNGIGGDTYLRIFPDAHTARFHSGASASWIAHGGRAVFGGRFAGITQTSQGYVVFYRDATLLVDGLTGATVVAATPGEQGVQVRFVFNEPPVAVAGPDLTVEANALGGAVVTLDGSLSVDDGEIAPLTYSWEWPGGSADGDIVDVFLPLGVIHITLTVDDGEFTDTDMAVITVQDTTPPETSCPADLTLEAGTAENEELYSEWLSSVTATDICDPEVDIIKDAPEWADLPIEGVDGVGTLVTWTATDDSGNEAMCCAVVRWLDTTSPEITAEMTPSILWPPNHKLVVVQALVVASDTVDPDPAIVLLSVTSNEPDDVHGTGDGATELDIQGAGIGQPDFEILLRAERAAVEEGRIYTIVYQATDFCGNAATVINTVVVPHDVGQRNRN